MNIILQKTDKIGNGESLNIIYYAKSLAKTYNLKFDKEKVCYNQKDFMKMLKESPGNEIIILDELEIPIPDHKRIKSLQQLEKEYIENNFLEEIDRALLKQAEYDAKHYGKSKLSLEIANKLADEMKPKNTKLYGKTRCKK